MFPLQALRVPTDVDINSQHSQSNPLNLKFKPLNQAVRLCRIAGLTKLLKLVKPIVSLFAHTLLDAGKHSPSPV